MYKGFNYTYGSGDRRYRGESYGHTWADALKNIHKFHPKRTNIRKVK